MPQSSEILPRIDLTCKIRMFKKSKSNILTFFICLYLYIYNNLLRNLKHKKQRFLYTIISRLRKTDKNQSYKITLEIRESFFR